MSSRHLAFSTVFVFVVVLTKVTDVNSCSMSSDDSLKVQELRTGSSRDTSSARTDDMFTKCVPGNPACSNCVPSGYELVNVSYVFQATKDAEVTKLAYKVTGCKCVAKKPLNTVVTNNKPKKESSFMLKYRMMSYCTYALSAVCAIFGVIIILLCLRYEICCSKNKKSGKIGKDEQHKPLTVQTSHEEKV